MPTSVETLSMLVGGVAGFYLLGTLAWSIAFPDRRIWPPITATHGIKFRVWLATIAIFGSTFVLGIANWNSLGWPTSFRWVVGILLILAGNTVVWIGVRKIGFGATSGEVTELHTDGLYRYSRNPQYIADMAILVGWAVLSASVGAICVAAAGIVVLAVAPFAEEPWLEDNFGDQFRNYKLRVHRYL